MRECVVTGNLNGFLLHCPQHVLTPLPALDKVMADREFPMISKGTLRDVIMAAGQDAAVGANAALDLRARETQWHVGAELHSGLRIIMGVVIIEDGG